MAASLNINDILTQVRQLDKEDQLTLLQRMASLIRRRETKKASSTRLSSLSGIGSEIWKSTADIDKYIDEERPFTVGCVPTALLGTLLKYYGTSGKQIPKF